MKSLSASSFSSRVFLLIGICVSAGLLVSASACSSSETVADGGTTSQTDGGADSATTPPPVDAASDTGTTVNDAGNDSGLTAQEQAYCDAVSKSSCFDAAASACEPSSRCLFGRLMTSQGMNEFIKCHLAPSCKSEDGCIRAAGLAVAPTASQAYEDACFAKRTACSDNFKDDYCTAAVYAFRADLAVDAEACIQKNCADVKGCFDALNLKVDNEVKACTQK
ncbi:MAG: hypothetical protein U0174_27280 [Polyangiaceae bacterium]